MGKNKHKVEGTGKGQVGSPLGAPFNYQQGEKGKEAGANQAETQALEQPNAKKAVVTKDPSNEPTLTIKDAPLVDNPDHKDKDMNSGVFKVDENSTVSPDKIPQGNRPKVVEEKQDKVVKAKCKTCKGDGIDLAHPYVVCSDCQGTGKV